MKTGSALLAAILLGGCASGGGLADTVARPIPFQTGAALGAIMGRDASQLVAQFGAPNADVREGPGRKLQFAGPICVLDAYLYPRGSSAPVVTHVDARQLDGSPIDEGSCIAAIQRRGGGK